MDYIIVVGNNGIVMKDDPGKARESVCDLAVLLWLKKHGMDTNHQRCQCYTISGERSKIQRMMKRASRQNDTIVRKNKEDRAFCMALENDHICTRMEHVAHVESVATTIAQKLGLNIDLVRAISLGHDIGHAPFGHQGEDVISKLSLEYLGKKFWYEQNGLRFVDDIELLPDSQDFRDIGA